jgi:hypothetical protein
MMTWRLAYAGFLINANYADRDDGMAQRTLCAEG